MDTDRILMILQEELMELSLEVTPKPWKKPPPTITVLTGTQALQVPISVRVRHKSPLTVKVLTGQGCRFV